MTMALAAQATAAPGVPDRPPVETRILYGDLRTGRITGVLPATSANWTRVQNDSGSIDQVSVHRTEVRRLNLAVNAAPARTFLAIEQGGRIRQFGPIWSHRWSRKSGRLVLSAGDLWSLFDHRKVMRVLAAGEQITTAGDLGTVTLTGADLGEIARGLIALALSHTGGNLPLVLPDPRPGSANTEAFPGRKLYWVAGQLKELTQRAVGAPDIRFTARRRADDARYLEAVLETGTGDAPQLAQAGRDWVFDTTARRGPVLDVEVAIDGAAVGMRSWVTGEGSDDDQLIATYLDSTLIDAGWPLLELDESHDSVNQWDTLDGYSRALVARHARPVATWRLTVRADAALEVLEGDYARVVVMGDDYLPDGQHRVRVQKISGDLGGATVLDMYPLDGAV